MTYFKPKDPVIADLLLTFTLLQKNSRAFKSASDLLTLAETYGLEAPADLKAELKLRTER